MDTIKPFNELPLIKYFQHDLEKIKMAYRLSGSILSDLSNIRAAGDEVELAVKNFYKGKLFPKYHVCDGHIVDMDLRASPQFDIIICEQSKNPVLFNLADKSEIVFFEAVYCFAEVKKSFYSKTLINEFADNIRRFKSEFKRELIDPKFIDTGTTGFQYELPLTSLPLRNPILTFQLFVDTKSMAFSDLSATLSSYDKSSLPNFIVLLDKGIILNVKKQEFEQNQIVINLYPEYEDSEGIWVLFELQDESGVLLYQYLLVLEHLSNTIVKNPNLREYTKKLFDYSRSNFHEL